MAPAVAAGGEPPQDALQYVRAVKTRFIRTSPQTYEQFLEVMRDFKNARCVRKASRLPLAFSRAQIPRTLSASTSRAADPSDAQSAGPTPARS